MRGEAVAEFDVAEAMEVLRRTPAVLDEWLRGLSEVWVMKNEGPETFSPYDVVGHLVHGEKADWIGRTRIILEEGEGRAFDPFDRFAMYEDSKGKTLPGLLDEFAALRAENLVALEGMELTDEDLDRTGTHPELGTVTLSQLLATWTVHDLSHIAQIARVMAKQYKHQAGPWREYIPLLDR
jgi:hypothetical protein